nr:pheromone precursor [Euplotes focardii]
MKITILIVTLCVLLASVQGFKARPHANANANAQAQVQTSTGSDCHGDTEYLIDDESCGCDHNGPSTCETAYSLDQSNHVLKDAYIETLCGTDYMGSDGFGDYNYGLDYGCNCCQVCIDYGHCGTVE